MPRVPQLSSAPPARGNYQCDAPNFRRTLPVFIAYADIPAAREAIGHLTAAHAKSHLGHRLQSRLWRFDQLQQECWQEMARRDALSAAAIVVAFSEDALPTTAENWLTSLARHRPEQPIAFLALVDGEFWTLALQPVAATSTFAAKKSPATLVALPAKKLAS